MVYMALTIFSRTILMIFLVLPVFVVVSTVIRLVLMSFCIPKHDKYACSPARFF